MKGQQQHILHSTCQHLSPQTQRFGRANHLPCPWSLPGKKKGSLYGSTASTLNYTKEMEDCKTRIRRPSSIRSSFLRLFHVLSHILLALLPLSLLLLVRLTCSPILLFALPTSAYYVLLTTVLTLQFIIPLIALHSLLHVFVSFLPDIGVAHAWVVLSIVQVSVGLGIEATVAAGITSPSFASTTIIACIHRVVFFIGVHETTVFWSRVFSKKVVDDTIYGIAMEETGVERMVLGVVLGLLWMGLLRKEVEGLAFVDAEGRYGFACWLIARLIMLIGTARVLKGMVQTGGRLMQILCQREAAEGKNERSWDDPTFMRERQTESDGVKLQG